MSATFDRSTDDIAFVEKLKWTMDAATWFAWIVMFVSTIAYFWSLFRVFQQSRGAVFQVVAATLLFCVTVVVVLAIVDPTVTTDWACIIVNRGEVVHGEVALQASLVSLRPDAIGNLVFAMIMLLSSLGITFWQLQPWWRARNARR